DNVQHQDVVKIVQGDRQVGLVEIVDEKLVEFDARRKREKIDSDDIAALAFAQLGGERAAGAPEVENSRARLDQLERDRLRTFEAELRHVPAVAETLLRLHVELTGVEKAHLLKACLRDGLDHVPAVLHSIHVTDLVAVIGRDGKLKDPLPGQNELDDDLGVEVEIVRVELERDPSQRIGRVDPVAGVKLAQIGSEHSVLPPCEDLVANELVRRHAAPSRGAGLEHPRTEDRIRRPGRERTDELGQTLRCVLAVAVYERDEMEALLDREMESDLLVPPVALVDRIDEDAQGEREL